MVKKWKENLNKWIGILWSYIEGFCIAEILPKFIQKFNPIAIKMQAMWFVSLQKLIQTFICEEKGPKVVKLIFQRNNNLRGILLDIQSYSIAELIKMVCPKDRHTDQWNRVRSPEIEPYKYAQLIFDEDKKAIQRGGIAFK